MCIGSNDNVNIISSPITWPKWGKEAGTITALEYAFLSEASYLNSKEEVYRFLRRQNFPEGHPFSTIRKDQIQYYDSEPQTLIIKLDSQNAIVVFAGTETLGDIFADTSFISVDNPSLQFRKQWANRIVQRLNSQGINHIVVAGHSLGGYLAVDVAMNNTTVKECVNFDGPGHRSDEIQSMTRHQVERIYNIANAWSPINMPLDQVGQTIKLELDTDYNNWASFIPNHAMQGIIHALGGYEYGTVK